MDDNGFYTLLFIMGLVSLFFVLAVMFNPCLAGVHSFGNWVAVYNEEFRMCHRCLKHERKTR